MTITTAERRAILDAGGFTMTTQQAHAGPASEAFAKPSIGRIVHYRGPGTANGQFPPKTYPAVITEVHGDKCVSLFVMTQVGCMNLSSIQFSEDREEPTRWTWPARA